MRVTQWDTELTAEIPGAGYWQSRATGDLPLGVRESLEKAWVGGGLLQGWGHGLWQYMPGIF